MTIIGNNRIVTISLAIYITHVSGFSVFSSQESKRLSVPSQIENVDIELPDFDVLFHQIREVSPLACMAFDCQEGGLAVSDEKYESPLKWKNVEAKKKATVHRIDKCEHYNGEKFPVVRFRSSLEGPCVGLKMVEYIMKIEERAQWDPQIDALTDMYVAKNLDDINKVLPDEYGHCAMFGIGYTRTKRYLVVDGREQLTLCGLQEFANGGALIWGVEIEERHDALFPKDQKRHTRAKTCLYSTALVPTGEGTFDAEYILQLDPGGNLPSFLTTPIMIDSVKTMFSQAKKDFGNAELMREWMKVHLGKGDDDDHNEDMMKERLGLLLTP